MKIGMLWFDNDPKTDLKAKVEKAMAYYEKKYGQAPNLAYVHPTMIAGANSKVSGVELRARREIRPHHFWIGIAEAAS